MNIRIGTITGEIIASITEENLAQTAPPDSWVRWVWVFQKFDFPDVAVVPENTYVIELIGTPPGYYEQGYYEDSYGRGRAIWDGNPEDHFDLTFQTYGYNVEGVECPIPISDQYNHADWIGEWWRIDCSAGNGQEFRPTLNTLAGVQAYLNNDVPATVTMNIRVGTISGKIIASMTQEFPACPPSTYGYPPIYEWRYFDFPDVPVVPEDTYVIELIGTGVTWWQAYYEDSYERGRPIFNGNPEDGHDLSFETFGYDAWASAGMVWTLDADGEPEMDFVPGEKVYIHWKANGMINMTIIAPDGVSVEKEWVYLPCSGVNSFLPSHGRGIYEVSCTGAEVKIISVGSIFVIPEMPFLPSLLALVAMFSAVFVTKRVHD